MALEPETAIGANQQRIERHVLSLPGVTTHEHAFGGTEYRLGKRELGHYHDDLELVDIPLPRKVRDAVVDAGQAEPHHIFPGTGWVSIWLHGPADVERAIELLQRSFDLARTHAERRRQPEEVGARSPSRT